MSAAHSPLPWHCVRDHGNPETASSLISIRSIGTNDILEIASVYCAEEGSKQAANAALIVKAVNHHDELVAAMRELLAAISYGGVDAADRVDIAERTARAALAAIES